MLLSSRHRYRLHQEHALEAGAEVIASMVFGLLDRPVGSTHVFLVTVIRLLEINLQIEIIIIYVNRPALLPA